MQPQDRSLPIYEVADKVVAELGNVGRLVLSAPTGSGKTTQVPQILLDAGCAGDGQILVLQPRRLATRLVALRVAQELGTQLGQIVGYQTRHESRQGPDTKILFLTEGLFLRRLLSNPQLSGIGAVVIDEFHERTIAADLSLGLCRHLQATGRPDLLLVVMSATLDTEALSQWLDCAALHAQGRSFPVDIDYAPGRPEAPVWVRAEHALRRWLQTGKSGHILVFMPGSFEIRRCLEAFASTAKQSEGGFDVFPLYGGLPPDQQDLAVAPGERRKVIVSTNVAETSITIDDIGCVIDSGLARVARYDPTRGVNALLIQNISLASAQQRAGRAGRTARGTCLRLWPESEAHARPPHDAPEIERVDLAEAMLLLAAFGIDPSQQASFRWLDPPPVERFDRARELLRQLGALDAEDVLTPIGQEMVDIPAHPRLARMLSLAHERGVGERGCVWAALVAERDICQRPLASRYRTIPDSGWPSDLAARAAAWDQARRSRFDSRRCDTLGLNAGACREVNRTVDQFRRWMKNLAPPSDPQNNSSDGHDEDQILARCLLAAFLDHVALRRSPDTRLCEMDGRRRVTLDRDSVVGDSQTLIAVQLREVEASRAEGGGVHTIASLATAIESGWIAEEAQAVVSSSSQLVWDVEEKAVFEIQGQRFGALLLDEHRRRAANSVQAAQLIVDRLLNGQLRFDRWDDAVDAWLARARCVAEWFPERSLSTYDEDDLAIIIAETVGEASRWGAVRQAPILDHLRHALSWEDQQFVEEMAPERIRLPTGHGMRIVYTPGQPPRGRAKIQDLYDVSETPRVAGGRIRLLLEILAPNFRPAQVTDDLPGFWKRTYPELKKELKRRYPKHEWR
ncbi:MAG: ATP-dependent helicase HrpB [Gemmatimonadaceae bacterium]|nr:ATP-dependent helicase HrpB [Gemmatimonadaceae bacterium]